MVYPSDPVYIKDISEEDKLQIWRLILKQSKAKTHVSSYLDLEDIGLTKGRFPKGIYPNPGIGAVSILNSEEEQIMSFKYQVRRNVKRAIEQNIEFIELLKSEELPLFYSICKLNAKENNYSIRPYFLFKTIWKRGLGSGSSRFIWQKKTVNVLEQYG